MTSINWDRAKRQQIMRQLDRDNTPKQKLKPMSEEMIKLFDTALKNTIPSSRHWAAVYSIKRQLQINGWISAKQGAYIRGLAKGKPTAHPGCLPPGSRASRTRPTGSPVGLGIKDELRTSSLNGSLKSLKGQQHNRGLK